MGNSVLTWDQPSLPLFRRLFVPPRRQTCLFRQVCFPTVADADHTVPNRHRTCQSVLEKTDSGTRAKLQRKDLSELALARPLASSTPAADDNCNQYRDGCLTRAGHRRAKLNIRTGTRPHGLLSNGDHLARRIADIAIEQSGFAPISPEMT